MDPKRVDPFTGLFNFLNALASEKKSTGHITTELYDNTIVDTCLPSDTDIWETGIRRSNIENKWIIADQYENEEKAKEGHKKWVNILSDYPDYPLEDIDLWNLGRIKSGETKRIN